MAPPDPTQATNAAKLAENQERLNRELEKYIVLKEKANDLDVQMTGIDGQKSANQTAALDKEQEIIAAKNQILELKKHMIGMEKEEADIYAKVIIDQQQLIATANEELKVLNKKKNVIDGLAKAQKEYGEAVEENLENAKKATETYGAIFKEFAGDLPVVGNALTKLFKQQGNMAKMGDKLISKSKGMTGVNAKMTKGLGKYLKGVGITTVAVFAFVGALARLALQFDGLSKDIGKATGFGNEFADTLTEGYKQTMSSGVAMKEYAGAVESLANNFSGFNPTAEATNVYLANTTSQLEKLGVSADSSSKLMDHFHRAMGVSQKAAANMTAQLVMLGKQAGITAGKMASDFAAATDTLAVYGKNQIKVFKQLAAQIKGTGLEMGSLLAMASPFDKFESGADAAAKLNAVLGTRISTVAMLNMNEAERIKLIKEQVQARIGSFDSLDKHTQRYVANAMGLKSVAEAQRLLNSNQAETDANAAKMKEQADVQAELADRAKELVPLMQKLKIAGMKFLMAFSPIIQMFTRLIGPISVVIDWVAWLVAAIGPLVTVLVAAWKIWTAFSAGFALAATPIGWVVMGIVALVAIFHQLFDLFGLKINPVFVNIFSHLAETLKMMVSPLGLVVKGMGMVGSAFEYVFGEAKKEKADLAGGFDIQALAEIDTSAVAAGINEIKSAVMELAGIKMDGFLAMHTDGSSSSFVMGSDGLIKSISEGKLIVDVKMPKMEIPDVLVKVFLDGVELRSKIVEQVEKSVGGMG